MLATGLGRAQLDLLQSYVCVVTIAYLRLPIRAYSGVRAVRMYLHVPWACAKEVMPTVSVTHVCLNTFIHPYKARAGRNNK